MIRKYEVVFALEGAWARLCVWLLKRVCKHKDEALAERLHEVAAEYQRRPADGWSAPPG